MQKLIEAYILGKLEQRTIDLLWIEFLKEPEWYDVFEAQPYLISYTKKRSLITYFGGGMRIPICLIRCSILYHLSS